MGFHPLHFPTLQLQCYNTIDVPTPTPAPAPVKAGMQWTFASKINRSLISQHFPSFPGSFQELGFKQD